MKIHSFRWKMLSALLVFSVLLIVTISISVGIYYKNQEMKQYGSLAYSYARTAAEYIDGDKILGYVESNEKDAYYEEVMDFLNCTQAQTDIRYYYVFIPYEDDLVYVWDAENEEGSCPLGYHEEYMTGGKEASFKAMAGITEEEIIVTDDDTYGYIGSAFYPIYDSAGKSVALVGVDLSMPDINKNLLYFVLVIIICIVAVVLIFISVLYLTLSKVFINPLNRLNHATKNIVSNLESENDIQIDISTNDEIEELASSFNQMYIEVKDYIQRLASITAEKERIGAELNVATQIQADMLPCIFPAFPERHEFDIYATMTPAKEVGGDFYDFFLIDDDHLALVIADVSGKGVPAALFMVISKTLIKNQALMGQGPKDILMKVNNQLCENNEAEMFVTVWLGILEISTGKLTAANAGHEYPAIKRAGGSFELLRDKHGFVLAGMENAKYREYEILLNKGDTVFVYTDGVAEATDSQNQLYGTERMIDALNRNNNSEPQQLISDVYADIDRFVGEAMQFDDITMLAINYKGSDSAGKNLKLPATVENWDKVYEFIEETLDDFGCQQKEKMKLLIASEEIYVNIANYAYQDIIGEAEIVLTCDEQAKSVMITFIDSGVPYNPLEKEDADVTLSAEERQIGGLGILMVKKSMDDVKYRYSNGFNMLSIVKKI